MRPALLLLGIGAWLLASLPAAAAEVRGEIRDKATGRPVPDAVVSVVGPGERRAAADGEGRFKLDRIPAGARDVKIEAPGYAAFVVKNLPLRDDRPIILDVSLKPGVATLAPQRIAADRPSRLAQTETSRRSITGDEVRRVAGARNDPILAIANTAGVKAAGLSGAPAVRGGGPGDNRYLIDGVEIGNPYHFGGLVSVFNAGTISKVDLYSGALPARFGNALSAVIDVETRNPRRDGLHGAIESNLLYSEALIEGPLGKAGALSLAGRRSYVDVVALPLISRIAPEFIAAGTVLPYFTDFQGKVVLDLPGDGRFDIVGVTAHDAVRVTLPGGGVGRSIGDFSLDNGYRSVGGIWRQPVSDTLSNRFTLSYQEPYQDMQAGRFFNLEDFRFKWTFADDVAWQASEQHQLRAGLRYDTINYLARRHQPDFSKLPRAQQGGGFGGPFGGGGRISIGQGQGTGSVTATASFPTPEEIAALPTRTTDTHGNQKVYAAYLEDAWAASEGLTLSLGMRYDQLDSTAENRLAPRGGLSWRVDPDTTLRLAYGQQYQFPSDAQLLPGFGNPNLRAAFSKDYVAGLDVQLSEKLFGRFEAYYRNLFGLVVSDPVANYANIGSGRSFGLESTLELAESDGWSGSLALTLSRSFRTTADKPEVPYEYDQPIVANLLATAPGVWGWTPSLKFRYSTGRPYTPVVGREQEATGTWKAIRGEQNSGKFPDGITWSGRLERHVGLFGLDDAFYLEVTQQAEALAIDYGQDFERYESPDNPSKPIFNYGLPPLPYLGYRVKF
ncbi:MAG: TonB-dependent receptor [Candidatus Sericytochromatia bacterium]|nr:TonB-dependent receptor [Candidatus Tanganyikabacteria bacterium]